MHIRLLIQPVCAVPRTHLTLFGQDIGSGTAKWHQLNTPLAPGLAPVRM